MKLVWLAIALASFVGSHFLLSHPLRARLVRTFGDKGFLLVYSIVAFATFGWAVVMFGRVPAGIPLWDGWGLLPWLAATLLTLLSAALFLASLFRNPALPGTSTSGLSTVTPRGVYRVTRHPMLMSFAIWGMAHILIAPTGRTILLAGSIIVLSLAGAHLQDRKKIALTGREWSTWASRTPFWPNLTKLREIGPIWFGAVPLWLALTYAHLPMAQIPAGLWRWIEQVL